MKLEDRAQEASRRAILTATKGFLDQAYAKRPGAAFMDVVKDLKPALAESASVFPIVDLILSIGQQIEKSAAGSARPVGKTRLRKVLAIIDAECTRKDVASWLKHSTRAHREAQQNVASSKGTVDESKLDTAVNALSPLRYMLPWLFEWQLRTLEPKTADNGDKAAIQATSSSALAVSIIRQHLESTPLSLDELLEIHDAFSSAVRNLPSVDVNEAAKLIGVTVDRVHRMAALHEIDTFFIRRRIPKGEIKIKKKGAAKEKLRGTASPVSPKITGAVVKSLAGTNFSILELTEIQDALEKRINRISYPLKSAIEQLGYTKVHVHLLVREGKLRSFGLPRLIPESETLRLQRDPSKPRMGRPRISEQEND